MIVLGIDPAKVAGWATATKRGARFCGTLRPVNKMDGGAAADLSRRLADVIVIHKPDLCVMEAPMPPGLTREGPRDLMGQKSRVAVTNMRNTLTTYGIRMCFLATLHSLKVPTFEVAVQTWRKGYYGKGVRPPAGTSDTRAWWKKRAVDQAEILKYPVNNDDEAEAVGIALWGLGHANRITDLGRQLAGPVYKGEKQ